MSFLKADERLEYGQARQVMDAISIQRAGIEDAQQGRQEVVFLRIDDHARYGRAVKLVDRCKGADATTLGIVTNK